MSEISLPTTTASKRQGLPSARHELASEFRSSEHVHLRVISNAYEIRVQSYEKFLIVLSFLYNFCKKLIFY